MGQCQPDWAPESLRIGRNPLSTMPSYACLHGNVQWGLVPVDCCARVSRLTPSLCQAEQSLLASEIPTLQHPASFHGGNIPSNHSLRVVLGKTIMSHLEWFQAHFRFQHKWESTVNFCLSTSMGKWCDRKRPRTPLERGLIIYAFSGHFPNLFSF